MKLVDTNCNHRNVDCVILNDSAIRAIKLLVAKAADAALEGKTMRKERTEVCRSARGRRKASGSADRLKPWSRPIRKGRRRPFSTNRSDAGEAT